MERRAFEVEISRQAWKEAVDVVAYLATRHVPSDWEADTSAETCVH